MKRLAFLTMCIFLLSGVSRSEAKFGAGAHAGLSFSSFPKEVKDYFGLGFGFGAQGDVDIMKYFGVRLNFDYHIFASDKAKLKQLQIRDDENNLISIQDVSGANVLVFGITANAVGKIPTTSSVTPYGLFGLGLHIVNISDAKIKTDRGEGTAKIRDSETDFGLNFGAGADFKLTKTVSLYGDFKYVLIFTKDENSSHFPITFGATFWF